MTTDYYYMGYIFVTGQSSNSSTLLYMLCGIYTCKFSLRARPHNNTHNTNVIYYKLQCCPNIQCVYYTQHRKNKQVAGLANDSNDLYSIRY